MATGLFGSEIQELTCPLCTPILRNTAWQHSKECAGKAAPLRGATIPVYLPEDPYQAL